MSELPKQQIEAGGQKEVLTLGKLRTLANNAVMNTEAVENIQGSSKDIEIYETSTESGETIRFAVFANDDRISIFDAGEIFDQKSPDKGKLEAIMTALLYKAVTVQNIRTHVIGIEDADPRLESEIFTPVGINRKPTHRLLVQMFHKPELPLIEESTYDYSEFATYAAQVESGESEHMILPAEVIYRQNVVAGVSSCTNSEEKWSGFLENFSTEEQDVLPTWDEIQKKAKGEMIQLPRPMVSMTTKYEKGGDKPMNQKKYNERMGITGGSSYSYEKVTEQAGKIGEIVIETMKQLGISVPDLKVELGIQNVNGKVEIVLLDVIGIDEIRMYLDESITDGKDSKLDFSKQVFRNLYFENTLWCQLLDKYKKAYGITWKDEFSKLNLKQPKLNEVVVTKNRAVINTLQGMFENAATDTFNLPVEGGLLRAAVNDLDQTIESVKAEGTLFSGDITQEQYDSAMSLVS